MAANMQLSNTPLFAEYLTLLQAANFQAQFAADRRLSRDDALLVIDMQNDFIPAEDKYKGGRFAVPEGDLIPPLVVQLIEETMKAGGTVCASRDYHPVDHCSFMSQGGHFPEHCVQGTEGSKLYPSIALAMAEAMKACNALGKLDARATVAFKGFHEDTDSFGGLPYEKGGEGRIKKRGSLMSDPFSGCNKAPWTGCLVMKCSGMCFDSKYDPDAPPDLLAAYKGATGGDTVMDLNKKLKSSRAKRLLVCGLALDFCVCDTALNARDLGFDEVVIVLDAARPAHVPGLGTIGSGFLQDPADILGKWTAAGVKLTSTLALTGAKLNLPPLAPPASGRGGFPESLGPFGVEATSMIRIGMDDTMTSFSMTYFGLLKQQMERFEYGSVLGNIGMCTPFAPITLPQEARAQLKIPSAAFTFSFAYPLPGVSQVPADRRMAFLEADSDANWRFILYGGFIYFDQTGTPIGANAIGSGTNLRFGAPEKWRAEYTARMVSDKLFQPVTLSSLRSAGAKWFAWVHAGETLLGPAGTWTPSQHGAFAYLFHDDPTEVSDRDVFFSVVG